MILFYIGRSDLLDVESSLLSSIRELRAKGFEVRILAPGPETKASQRLAELRLDCDQLTIPGVLLKEFHWSRIFPWAWAHLVYARCLLRYFELYPFQAVHAIGIRGQMYSVLLKIRFASTLIWQIWEIPPKRGLRFLFHVLFSIFCDLGLIVDPKVAEILGRSSRWRSRLRVLESTKDLGAVYTESSKNFSKPARRDKDAA